MSGSFFVVCFVDVPFEGFQRRLKNRSKDKSKRKCFSANSSVTVVKDEAESVVYF